MQHILLCTVSHYVGIIWIWYIRCVIIIFRKFPIDNESIISFIFMYLNSTLTLGLNSITLVLFVRDTCNNMWLTHRLKTFKMQKKEKRCDPVISLCTPPLECIINLLRWFLYVNQKYQPPFLCRCASARPSIATIFLKYRPAFESRCDRGEWRQWTRDQLTQWRHAVDSASVHALRTAMDSGKMKE